MSQLLLGIYKTIAVSTFLALSILCLTKSPKSHQIPIEETMRIHNGELEFKRGDILIKANHNNIVGSSFIEGGSTFGHAAIVLEGGKDTNAIALLKRTTIFESHAQDVPNHLQIRTIKAHQESNSKDSICLSFSNKYLGGRYLLRANLSDNQIEDIINFIIDKDDGTSSWRATKDYNKSNYDSPRNWYCSLLIWQAFYTVLDKDIDVNKGLIVYPNDIINSPLFKEEGSIIRF
jgi:hypothetical protein